MGGAAGGAAAAATPAELERTIAWTNAAFTALIAVTLGVSFGVRDSTLLVDAAEAGEGTPSFAREFDAVAAAACMALAVGCWLLRTRTQNAAKRVLADAVTSNLLHVGVAHVLFRYSRALTLVSPDSGHRIPVLYFAGILVAGVDAAITMDAFRAYRISTGAESASHAWPRFSQGATQAGITGGHAFLSAATAVARAYAHPAVYYTLGAVNLAYVLMAVARAWPGALHGPGAGARRLAGLSPVEQLSAARMNLLQGGWRAAGVMFTPMFVAMAAEVAYDAGVLPHGVADVLTRQQLVLRAAEAGYMLVTAVTVNDEAAALAATNEALELQLTTRVRQDEARTALLRFLFHEVRGPLQSVNMGLLLLDGSGSLPPEHRADVDIMLAATSTAMAVLTNTLDVARMERGEEVPLELAPLGVAEFAASVLRQNSPFAAGMGVRLACEVDPGAPAHVLAAALQLRQVLNNFVTNAVKFSANAATVWRGGKPPTASEGGALPGAEGGSVTLFVGTRLPAAVTTRLAAGGAFRRCNVGDDDEGLASLGGAGRGRGGDDSGSGAPPTDDGDPAAAHAVVSVAPARGGARVCAAPCMPSPRGEAPPAAARVGGEAARHDGAGMLGMPEAAPAPSPAGSPGAPRAQRTGSVVTDVSAAWPPDLQSQSSGAGGSGGGGAAPASDAGASGALTSALSTGSAITPPDGWARLGRPQWVYFTVLDNGAGLPREALSRLFRPFQMLHHNSQGGAPESAVKGRGTGLGLAISRFIAHRLGGEVGVWSSPGVGSAFYIKLPLQPLAPPPDDGGGGFDEPHGDAESVVSPSAAGGVGWEPAGGPEGRSPEGGGGGRRSPWVQRSRDSGVEGDDVVEEATGVDARSVASGGASSAASRSRSVVAGGARWAGTPADPAGPIGMGYGSSLNHDATLARMKLWSPTPGPAGATGGAGAEAHSAGACAGAAAPAPDPLLPPSPTGASATTDGAAGEAPAGRGARFAGPVGCGGDLGRLRYLVVDDNSSNRTFLARLLRRRAPDATVGEVVDGVAALEEMARARAQHGWLYDVMCMDGDMPRMDGYQCTAQLRREGYAGLVLGCTGNALPADLQMFTDAGADDVFTKPLDPSRIIARAHELLRARGSGGGDGGGGGGGGARAQS